MQSKAWLAGLALPLLAAAPAGAEIIKGALFVRGAEMSWWGGMARDAIARQYDVDKNSVTLIPEAYKGDKKSYQPGTITFQAKKGRSIDLEKVRESIAATRLSGGTNMKMDWLEITATGDVDVSGNELLLKVAGSGQEFVLAEEPEAKSALQQLRDAKAGGARIASVTGRVAGWNGVFPAVLRSVAAQNGKRTVLMVTAFEVAK